VPKKAEKSAAPRTTPRVRRALSHVGGAVEILGGTPEEQRALERALAVKPDEMATQRHVHGFHSYPARLHPDTARELVLGFSRAGASVLDPFCGSGTVLVEARLAGRRAFGSDVNPLALELSSMKANGPGTPWSRRIVAGAREVAAHADERRRARAGPTRRYGEEDLELFEPHVLLELDGLRAGIRRLSHEALERSLMLVLSAVLTKVSTRAGDTGRREAPKRLSGGFTLRFFVQRAEDLARRLDEARALLPARAPRAELFLADARRLEPVATRSIDLIVTSPPYPGVYDYLVHHRDRLRWLGFDAGRFSLLEIGARRHTRDLSFRPALARYRSELGRTLDEVRRVLTPRGGAVMVVADAVLAQHAVRTDELVRDLSSQSGLELVSAASQRRPHFHAPTRDVFSDAPRREHALLLRPAG